MTEGSDLYPHIHDLSSVYAVEGFHFSHFGFVILVSGDMSYVRHISGVY